MESYELSGMATLSQDDIETTDNLITSAIKAVPKSAVAEVFPLVKTKGPTSQWVEPWYGEEKLELITSPVTMFTEENRRRQLRITQEAVQDLRRMYTPESFSSLIKSWALFHKNTKQQNELVALLQSPIVNDVPPDAEVPEISDFMTEDEIRNINTKVLRIISDLQQDFQLSDSHFSIIAPYECAYAFTIAQGLDLNLHTMFDENLDRIYVMPTGDRGLTRAGIGIFEYADEVQKGTDFETGESCYWFYNRSKLVVNPIHDKMPIIRNIIIT